MKKIIILFILTNSLQVFSKKSEKITFKSQHKTRSINQTAESIKISFTGDLIIHNDLYLKIMKDKNQDFSILWKKTIPLFEKADFSYLNLEGAVAMGIDRKLKDRGDVGFTYDLDVYSGTNFLFNYHPKLIDALIKTGVDIVSTANNHTFDRGSIGVDKTIDALVEKNLTFVGTRKAGSTSQFYTTTKIKNFNIAWISCSEALNGFKDKKSQILLCFDQKNELLNIIKNLKSDKTIDAIIVLPHWGQEYKHEPNQKQIQLSYELAEAGAIAVIGSHPHVLQPVEKYVTKDNRETFIAYSLGNFVAYQKNIERKSSALIYLDFEKTESGETFISKYSYEPTTRTGADIYPARHLPEVVKHVEKFLGPLD